MHLKTKTVPRPRHVSRPSTLKGRDRQEERGKGKKEKGRKRGEQSDERRDRIWPPLTKSWTTGHVTVTVATVTGIVSIQCQKKKPKLLL